jgi:transposase
VLVLEALDAVERWLASQKIVRDLDTGLVGAVGLTATNAAEASGTFAVSADLACQQVMLSHLHIDRAYRSHTLVRERSAQLQMYCKA